MFRPNEWRIEAIRYHVVTFLYSLFSNFLRKSKLKHILILGGEKFLKIRKFENTKNSEKAKMSFVEKRGNDSTSVDYHSTLKNCKAKSDKQSYCGCASRFSHI